MVHSGQGRMERVNRSPVRAVPPSAAVLLFLILPRPAALGAADSWSSFVAVTQQIGAAHCAFAERLPELVFLDGQLSGFFIDKQRIVTAGHACEGKKTCSFKNVQAHDAGGSLRYLEVECERDPAYLHGVSHARDLARCTVLDASWTAPRHLSFCSEQLVSVGPRQAEEVSGVGFGCRVAFGVPLKDEVSWGFMLVAAPMAVPLELNPAPAVFVGCGGKSLVALLGQACSGDSGGPVLRGHRKDLNSCVLGVISCGQGTGKPCLAPTGTKANYVTSTDAAWLRQ